MNWMKKSSDTFDVRLQNMQKKRGKKGEKRIGVTVLLIRKNDVETKWIVASADAKFTEKEIREAVNFQEKFFKSQIIF